MRLFNSPYCEEKSMSSKINKFLGKLVDLFLIRLSEYSLGHQWRRVHVNLGYRTHTIEIFTIGAIIISPMNHDFVGFVSIWILAQKEDNAVQWKFNGSTPRFGNGSVFGMLCFGDLVVWVNKCKISRYNYRIGNRIICRNLFFSMLTVPHRVRIVSAVKKRLLCPPDMFFIEHVRPVKFGKSNRLQEPLDTLHLLANAFQNIWKGIL